MDKIKIFRMLKLAKTYSGLWQDDDIGFCAVGNDVQGTYIQLDESSLSEIHNIFPELPVTISRRKGDTPYPYQASVMIDGISFMTIGTRKELDAVGLWSEDG